MDLFEREGIEIRELEGKLQALPEPGPDRKMLAKVRCLERRVTALRNEQDAVGGAAACITEGLKKDLEALEAQLSHGVDEGLLLPKNLLAVPWDSFKRLAWLAGGKEDHLGTSLMHAVLARQSEYKEHLNYLEVNIGNITIGFKPEAVARQIDETAEGYLKKE